MLTLPAALAQCPLVAILRGIRPEESVEVGTALTEAGLVIVEVPLNSPEPFESIRRLAKALGDKALVGGGTVLTPEDARRVAEAGGRLVVSPNCDPRVVREAKRLGLAAMPGFATPTEAFLALEAGADALKLFPAEAYPPPVLRALRAVLPAQVPVLPVGSISLEDLAEYWAAGAAGFGLGSGVYHSGARAQDVGHAARAFKSALDSLPAR